MQPDAALTLDPSAAADPLVQFLLTTPYAHLVAYYIALRYACSELAPWLPASWRTDTAPSSLFILSKVIDKLGGGYGAAANPNAAPIFKTLLVRILSANGLAVIPKEETPAPPPTA